MWVKIHARDVDKGYSFPFEIAKGGRKSLTFYGKGS